MGGGGGRDYSGGLRSTYPRDRPQQIEKPPPSRRQRRRFNQALIAFLQRTTDRIVLALAGEVPEPSEETPCLELQAVDVEGPEHAGDSSIVGPDCVRPKIRLSDDRSCHAWISS